MLKPQIISLSSKNWYRKKSLIQIRGESDSHAHLVKRIWCGPRPGNPGRIAPCWAHLKGFEAPSDQDVFDSALIWKLDREGNVRQFPYPLVSLQHSANCYFASQGISEECFFPLTLLLDMEWESSFKGRDKRSSFPRSKPVTQSTVSFFSHIKFLNILKIPVKTTNRLKQYNANSQQAGDSASHSLLKSGSQK